MISPFSPGTNETFPTAIRQVHTAVSCNSSYEVIRLLIAITVATKLPVEQTANDITDCIWYHMPVSRLIGHILIPKTSLMGILMYNVACVR